MSAKTASWSVVLFLLGLVAAGGRVGTAAGQEAASRIPAPTPAQRSAQVGSLPEGVAEPLPEPAGPAEEPAAEPVGDDAWPQPGDCGNYGEYCDEYCDDPALCEPDPCEGFYCAAPGRFWARADWLVWWMRGARVPALVSTAPAGTAPDDLATHLSGNLFGGGDLFTDARHGGRIRLGMWLDCGQTCGIEGEWFGFGQKEDAFQSISSGEPIVVRPFYDVEQMIPAVEIVAYPGLAVGCLQASAHDYFNSAGLWYRGNMCCCAPCGCDCYDPCGYAACGPRSFRLDLVAGYRFYRLSGDLSIHEGVVLTEDVPDPPPGTMFDITDTFRARNDFHGGELGLVAVGQRGRWSWEATAKMALGANRQTVTIDGATAITVPGEESLYYRGGFLALDSNMGRYGASDFVVIPQFAFEVGYMLTNNLRVNLGYTFLYWANVTRAGQQVDTMIDPRNIPPVEQGAEPYPAFTFNNSGFWAQGLNLGLELRF